MNKKGFANIILVVVIVILVGAVGYFAFVKKSGPVAQQPTPTPTQVTSTPKSNPTPTPTPTTNAQSLTDPKGVVSIILPISWTNNGFGSSGAFIGDVKQTFKAEWGEGVQLQPRSLPKYPTGGAVGLAIFKFPASAPDFKAFLDGIGIGHSEDRSLTVNGYSAYYSKDVTNSYTDYYYHISNGSILVQFTFREISRGFSPGGATVTSEEKYTQYLPDFESIVNSIKFK